MDNRQKPSAISGDLGNDLQTLTKSSESPQSCQNPPSNPKNVQKLKTLQGRLRVARKT